MNVRHQNNFDLLRLLAAFTVVFSHYLRLFAIGDDPVKGLTGLSDFSTFGVITFFVISGYLVSKSLLAADSRNAFFANRSLRIFPGYLTCLLMCVFVAGAISTTWALSDYLTSYKTYLFFLNSYLYTLQYQLPGVFENNPRQFTVNSAIWTLCIEFTAYAILYMLFHKERAVKARRIVYAAVATLALNAIYFNSRILLAWQIEDPLGAYFIYYFNAVASMKLILHFFIGASFSLIDPKWLKSKTAFGVLAAVWVLSCNTRAYEVVEFLTVPYCVMFVGLSYWAPGARVLHRVGDLSYGIYLYHSPVAQTIWAKCHQTLNTPTMVIISVCITTGISWLSWTFIEKTALSWKRYSSHKMTIPMENTRDRESKYDDEELRRSA